MAGFCELEAGLQAPILDLPSAKWPIVSGRHAENSRFWEIVVGDRVRSHCVGELPVQLVEFSAMPGGKLGTPSLDCHAEPAVQLAKFLSIAVGKLAMRSRAAARYGFFCGSFNPHLTPHKFGSLPVTFFLRK
jgi:hypothetical protein